MRKLSPFMQHFEQLPSALPVFPLPNAIIMPGSNLPLNIFEPRYLNLFEDALKTHHLVGMVQPRDDSSRPTLYEVGCAGRITRYAETSDGRLEVALTGLCRFRIVEELTTTRGYRMVKPDWQPFIIDYDTSSEPSKSDGLAFRTAMRGYLEQRDMQADWEVLDKLSSEELVNSLVSVLPLGIEDKQMLMETDTLSHRVQAFTAILENKNKPSAVKH